MKISVILNTVRDSFPLVNLPLRHIFDPTLGSLENQDFSHGDFELIIVDGAWSTERAMYVREYPRTFHVKHLNGWDWPTCSFWWSTGMVAISAPKNYGLTHAEGELVFWCDDCSELAPDLLKRMWHWHQRGYQTFCLFIYYRGGKPLLKADYHRTSEDLMTTDEQAERFLRLYRPQDVMRDSRDPITGAARIVYPKGDWYFGYSATPLEYLLDVNGYDENFDGTKSLEDPDLGSRLEMAGHRKFVYDKRCGVIEHDHVKPSMLKYEGPDFKSNYPLLLLNRRKGRFRANSDILADADIEFLKEQTRALPEGPRIALDSDLFKLWVNTQKQRIFDLRAIREGSEG